MSQPLVSVITVCYNAQDSIKDTMQSVLEQTYPYIDYILIDGESEDKTFEIIEEYKSALNKLTSLTILSEPDQGIYYAMNKGIDLAKGEWLMFLNSGDRFYSKNVISQIFNKRYSSNISVIYGDSYTLFSWGGFIAKARDESEYMPFVHQSAFVRCDCLKKYRFDTKFKIAADRDLFFRLQKNDEKRIYVPIVVSVYEAENGFSSRNPYIMMKEDGIIRGYNKRNIQTLLYYLYITFRYRFSGPLKYLIPNRIKSRFIKRRLNAKNV